MNTDNMSFERIRNLVQDVFGIKIKQTLVERKLEPVFQRYGIQSYKELENVLVRNRHTEAWTALANAATINKTDFFREVNHFNYIQGNVREIIARNPRIVRNREFRAWSAGCASGEEPYTLAMVLRECIPADITVKILATDISKEVLSRAKSAVYPESIKDTVEHYYLNKYFVKSNRNYQVIDSIKKMVTIRSFNLMELFPFSKGFDTIFCRNVMIYFDSPTQARLVNKFYDVLAPGGLLFIGHSESLANLRHRFKYLKPTIYVK